ncbi:hypothetical protein OR571_15940 [Psychrobacillus sp. NEAU-3TGS]|uniref:hypothetical protein n=1 Tax=Psychrobacillus sp. NEAU-3TGS TaxID=2995412 RepID=UPI00249650DF|nr:hypothetical protein [Psychrobacillus sp. NEAU-3TGS]MDI2588563.1 hypothetical protein [Psychrobacillus sp. NEAU-3TGS]
MKFNDAILLGDFVKAKELASQMDMDSLRETLFLLAYENHNIATYGFISYLLLEEETSEFHYIASYLFSMALNHLEGAYQTAFYHAKKATDLSPNDMSYKEYMLFLNTIPDKLLEDEEASEIANVILNNEPNNKVAVSVISETTN